MLKSRYSIPEMIVSYLHYPHDIDNPRITSLPRNLLAAPSLTYLSRRRIGGERNSSPLSGHGTRRGEVADYNERPCGRHSVIARFPEYNPLKSQAKNI